MRNIGPLILGLAFLAQAVSLAKTSQPTTAEQQFVSTTSAKLQSAYPSTLVAKAKGYTMLEGSIDSDNTYNFTNRDFTNVTPDRPNFLWYDRKGHLAGVDYEMPKSKFPSPPQLAAFPVQASRWVTIPEHVHYAYTADGKTVYGVVRATPALRTNDITLEMLRANKAKIPADAKLAWAMYHPAVWDLAMWTVPNPNGAFADLNPNVK